MRVMTPAEFEEEFDEIMMLVEVGERFTIQRNGIDILGLEPVGVPVCQER